MGAANVALGSESGTERRVDIGEPGPRRTSTCWRRVNVRCWRLAAPQVRVCALLFCGQEGWRVWLPIVVVGLMQEAAALEAVNDKLAAVGIRANISGRLGADSEVDEVASVVRRHRVGDLMRDPGVGRTRDTVPRLDRVHMVAVPEHSGGTRLAFMPRRPIPKRPGPASFIAGVSSR